MTNFELLRCAKLCRDENECYNCNLNLWCLLLHKISWQSKSRHSLIAESKGRERPLRDQRQSTRAYKDSFILNIYIAPLQESYSRALPTPARLKRAVLRWEKNAGERVLWKIPSSEGRPFQVEGPTTENVRICLVEVWAKSTRRRPCWDVQSNCDDNS